MVSVNIEVAYAYYGNKKKIIFEDLKNVGMFLFSY